MPLLRCIKLWIFSLLFVFLFLSSSLAAEVEAITKPSADILVSFILGGRVSSLRVTEGDQVKQGQLLVQQEDRAERIKLQQLRDRAADDTPVRMVLIELAQKEEDLKRMEWAKSQGAATDWEIEHARLEKQMAELAKEKAIFELSQARLQSNELRTRIEQLALHSPISGRVEEVVIEIGEATEALSPVIRIVSINPLWIDAQVPLELSQKLKTGQTVDVVFDVITDGKGASIQGQIVNIAGVADAASNTLRVRIKVPNKSHRPAGERVKILLN